jgi:hypothetical protein
MGTLRDHDVICPNCSARFIAGLVNAVNVSRFPEMKTQIVDRTFNRAKCPQCHTVAAVERRLLYTDTAANLFVVVHPRKQRHLHVRAVAEARRTVSPIARGGVLHADNVRVVFGLEELREKIVGNAAGRSDQLIELMKLYVIREHPFLVRKRRMRVTLDSVDTEKFTFNCTFDHERQAFQVFVPAAFLDSLGEQLTRRGKHAKPFADVARSFNPGPNVGWVNLWSLNPGNDALGGLRRYAEDIEAGRPVDFDSDAFKRMLDTLPSGAQLGSQAKRDLFTLEQHARAAGRADVEDKLFQVRFGFELDDDWTRNADKDDIQVLWALLKNLPDIAVAGNTWIEEIRLDPTNYSGLYDPREREIVISDQLASGSTSFRNVVLHEVGHSVHSKLDSDRSNLVTKWLTDQYGWRRYGLRSADIDRWIEEMGGYPAGTTEGTKTQIRSYISQSTGSETMQRPAILNGPNGHLWNSTSFGPRAAFEQTTSDWWQTCQGWHLANGKRFFVNHYYRELMSVSDAAVLQVPSMPSNYAAMSPNEYFAELFAWIFDEQALHRENISDGVLQWFQANIGSLDLAAPGPAAGAPAVLARLQRSRGRRIVFIPPLDGPAAARPSSRPSAKSKQRNKNRRRADARH